MFDRWREESERDPRLLYQQRSDNPNRQFKDKEVKKKRRPRLPTCCRPGCFEIRTPPDPYCSPLCESMSGGNE